MVGVGDWAGLITLIITIFSNEITLTLKFSMQLFQNEMLYLTGNICDFNLRAVVKA